MNTTDLELAEFSLVLRDVEEYKHVFHNLNPRLLASEEIIPDNWDWDSEEFQPFYRHYSTSFKNDVQLMGSSDYLAAYQQDGLELGKSPELLNCFISYIKFLAPNVFDKAEMSWNFRVERKNPSTWIRTRFFQPNLIPKEWRNPQAVPAFSFRSKDSLIFYRFSVDDENTFLAINCQAHTLFPTDDAGLSEWLSSFHDHETAMLTNLWQLLET